MRSGDFVPQGQGRIVVVPFDLTAPCAPRVERLRFHTGSRRVPNQGFVLHREKQHGLSNGSSVGDCRPLLIGHVHAGEYADPQGFKLASPARWKAAAKEESKVNISGPESGDGTPIVNVRAVKYRMELTEENEKVLLDTSKSGFTARGWTASKIKTTHIVADGHKLFCVEYDLNNSAANRARMRSIVFPTKTGHVHFNLGETKSTSSERRTRFSRHDRQPEVRCRAWSFDRR